MNYDVVLTCAVTGAGDTSGKSRHVPVTPKEISDSAIEAAKAGASIVHIHARDPETGQGSREPKLFKEIVDEFLDFISADSIVAHNAPFDIGFLNFELQKCGKMILPNRAIDTVTMAREKFPGQSVSLDALCKRLSIDNTLREKHSATLDAELLARVYIELNDAREPSLDLAIDVENNMIDTDFDIALIQKRNLTRKITDEEERLHNEFIGTLGKDAIWLKIKDD